MNINNLLKPIKENAISSIITFFFGAIITTITFHFTASPTASDKVKGKLTEIAWKRISEQLGQAHLPEIAIQKYAAQKIGLDTSESLVIFGSFKSANNQLNRWLALFTPEEQGVLDKIIGRPGFYSISSLDTIPIDSDEELVANSIEFRSVGMEETPAIIVGLRSTWADSQAVGFLILQKNNKNQWQSFGLPSITKTTQETLNGKPPTEENFKPALPPYMFFGPVKKSSRKEIFNLSIVKKMDIYEDEYVSTHGKNKYHFSMLRNGGYYKIVQHPFKGNMDIATVGFFEDGNATLGRHYSIASTFSIENAKLTRDVNWNWGYPMVSTVPFNSDEIEFESVYKAGVDAHKEANTMFWYTSFEKK